MPLVEPSIDPGRLQTALDAARSCASTYRARLAPDEFVSDPELFRFGAADLGDPDSELPKAVIARHCELRGLPYGRDGASLIFQRYAHRLCGIGVCSWAVTGGLLPDLRAANVATVIEGANPKETLLGSAGVFTDAGVDDLVRVLVDEHLAPMIDAWRAACTISPRNLWGNIAASMALAVRRAAPIIGIEAGLELGTAIEAACPKLAGLGDYRIVEAYGTRGVFFDRRTCCHWYAARDGKYCSWCVHTPPDERQERFEAMLEPKTA